jgi:hypothetical protein
VGEDPMLSGTASVEPYLARLRQRGGVDALMLATDRGGAELALRQMSQSGVRWAPWVATRSAASKPPAIWPKGSGCRLPTSSINPRAQWPVRHRVRTRLSRRAPRSSRRRGL